ncbi:hypothetical protein IJT17_05755, partial [bacterium]|nr:hypothetical protein [bacterium]
MAADGFGFSASEAESVPDRSALLKAIQSPQSDSSAPAAAPEEQPETAKAEGTQQNAAIEAPGPNASTEDIAVYCNSIAKSGGSVAQ